MEILGRCPTGAATPRFSTPKMGPFPRLSSYRATATRRHVIPAAADRRASDWLFIGHTGGGRALTPVIERALDPTTWLIVSGWPATERERGIID